MVITIDFSTDTIIRWTKIDEVDNITTFKGPDDYDPLVYDYIPQTSGVFDPNGFIRKPIETEENT